MSLSLNRKILVILKSIPFIIIVTFVWFHLKINNNYESNVKTKNTLEDQMKSSLNVFNSTQLSLNVNQKSVKEMREIIENINKNENILNNELFEPLNDNEMVIIVQVHNRVQYLLALIKSLEKTKDINQVLLIFSHDIFDTQINSIINSIKFCKVIQIFFPFSLQLNPNSFPGESADDCPRNIKKEEAVKIGCINALNPDSYGHYREAKYSQTKHHWWWKINHVFDQLTHTRNHFGYFMFLEEDHYLSPDALHTWNLMNEFRLNECEKCDVITLGIYPKSVNFAKYGNKIELSKWMSSRHNMGFVIDRNIWNKIISCGNQFCTYDDYNWDWSLNYISQKCLTSPLITVVVSTPRVYHIGECGIHHRGKNCNNNQIISTVENVFESSKKYLFPEVLVLQRGIKQAFKTTKVNGGID